MMDMNAGHCVSGCNYFQVMESFDKLIKVSSAKWIIDSLFFR